MASIFELFLTILTLLITALAQEDQTEKIWGAVVFTVPGDASLINQPPVLSSTGAEQARRAGETIRHRYIVGDNGTIPGFHPIPKLAKDGARDKMEHKLLNIWSTNEQSVVGTAQSFMQALYPPLIGGGVGNGNVTQWPAISAVTENDYNYNWLAGADQCQTHQINTAKYIGTKQYNDTQSSTFRYYRALAPNFPSLPPAYLAYANAPTIASIAEYLHANDEMFRRNFSSADVAYLRYLGSQHTWDNYGRYSTGNPIPVIGGRMLAGKIFDQLSNIVKSANGPPLSLLFGPAESLMSFYSISGLAAKPEFHQLPLPGSVIVFEVFSPGNEDPLKSRLLIDSSKLSVRALVRNGTAPSEGLKPVQLFYRQTSPPAIPWREFSKEMTRVAITDPSEWCKQCQSLNIFCVGLLAGSDTTTGDKKDCPASGAISTGCGPLSPIASGFIGALIATVLVIMILTMCFCSARKKSNDNGEVGRQAETAGEKKGWFGFLRRKRSQKERRMSDRDVPDVTPEGKGPKTNSWELRNSPAKPAPGPLVVRTATPELDEYVIQEESVSPVSPIEENGVNGGVERLRSTKDYSRRERELAAEDEADAAGVGRQEPRTII